MGITDSSQAIYFFGETSLSGVSHLPLMNTLFIDPQIPSLLDFDFLIVTSKRSIAALFSFEYKFKDIKLFCVGEKTADFARSHGLNVVHTSKGYAKDLIREILPKIKGMKGLYLRPKTVANSYISDYVNKGLLKEAICYETQCKKNIEQELIQPARLLFAAPSQVECFLKHFSFDAKDKIMVIGKTTAEALPKNIPYVIASKPSLDVMLKEVGTE